MKPSLDFLTACWSAPIGALACINIWYWLMIASIVVGLALWLWVALSYWSWRRKYAAALAAEARRQYIDRDAIEASRWRGDDHPIPSDLTIEKRPEPNVVGNRELGK